MKKSFFLFLSLGLLGVIVFLFLSFHSKNLSDYEYGYNQKSSQITFFGFKWESANVTAIETLISDFMARNPSVTVLYESIKGRDYFPVLLKRIATGNGDDVFMVDHDSLLTLSRQGCLKDLSGLPEIRTYSNLALSQMREPDGAVYFLPMSISAFGLYCNLDLLNKYNVSIPRTYQDFLEACRVFSDAGITPVVANNDISLKTLVLARGLYDLYEGEDTAQRLAALNSGQTRLSAYLKPGFELLKHLCDRGYIDPEKTLRTTKTKDDLVEFARGESPFMLTGVWASVRMEKMVEFPYKVVPYPVREDGPVLVINIDIRLALNAHAKEPEEALRFLRHMVTPSAIAAYNLSQASFSPLQETPPLPDDAVRDIGEHLRKGRIMLGADGHLDFPIWEITRVASRMLVEGASVEEAMRYLDETVDLALAGGKK
ncbi:MAG TPA: extracellular solute-binding protein [Candidatus Bilophila faecipullorum]|uniref:Extracellular solute-binding protein n=1 Tax=Candidatus Bilophila faecipullorum TaxID=2838482 RepID=A0A9D1U8Z2_9BACT|nr:extracellular solute-binding protein [uncultured Bilophila sp.]HIW77640.1 extracellular solute-binding protein [Candidatus Bilophila faecipullorum]